MYSTDIIEEMNAIRHAIHMCHRDATIADIERQIRGRRIPRHTLQRRLSRLAEQGLVRIYGNTRGTRYELMRGWNEDGIPGYGSLGIFDIPLSPAGHDIQEYVGRSLQQRTPVSYYQPLLEKYLPNSTFYLLDGDRTKLSNMGRMNTSYQEAGTYSKDILSRLLVDLSWNSSRLEGNTYSLLDTQRLINFGETADGKSPQEAQMILNHKNAIEFLIQPSKEIGINRYTLLNLHAMLADNLLPDPQAVGRLRQSGVGISQSVFTPLAVPQMINEYFEMIIAKARDIRDPYEQSFFMMVHLPYLQPFDDVNKRVARLVSNIPFIQKNLSPLSFVDVPNNLYIQGMLGVYELRQYDLLKDIYMWAYERSAYRYAALRQSMGEPDPFRLRYRQQIYDLVSTVMRENMTAQESSHLIDQHTSNLPQTDQARFNEMVSTELLSLHEGNFARYHVTPSQFETWKKQWGERH